MAMNILEKIYNSGLKLLYPSTPEDTYKVIVDESIKLVNADEAMIVSSVNDKLKVEYGSFKGATSIKLRKKGFAYRAFKNNKSFVVHTKKQFEELNPEEAKSHGLRSIVFIPLSNRGETVGVLAVRSRNEGGILKKRELKILQLFGSLASLAIRKAQLYTETKDALETRDLFISLAAHELRTPLTTINGYLQLLLSKIRDKKPIQNTWIMELALESQRLNTLVEEFLEINRIKSGKLQFNWQECSVKDILRRTILNFKFNNPNRKLVVHDRLDSKEDKVIGDPNKLIEVLNNVLENAGKYSAKDKKITISLKYKSPYFIFEIVDEGQGISEKDMSLVFKGFYKGRNSVHEGMGLGLYLAKNIISSHRGEIDIKSKLNTGTKVRIMLPKLEV